MLNKNKYTLKQLRGLKGMSQEELAHAVGLSRKTINVYESDFYQFQKVSMLKLIEIAKVLDVQVSDIYVGE